MKLFRSRGRHPRAAKVLDAVSGVVPGAVTGAAFVKARVPRGIPRGVSRGVVTGLAVGLLAVTLTACGSGGAPAPTASAASKISTSATPSATSSEAKATANTATASATATPPTTSAPATTTPSPTSAAPSAGPIVTTTNPSAVPSTNQSANPSAVPSLPPQSGSVSPQPPSVAPVAPAAPPAQPNFTEFASRDAALAGAQNTLIQRLSAATTLNQAVAAINDPSCAWSKWVVVADDVQATQCISGGKALYVLYSFRTADLAQLKDEVGRTTLASGGGNLIYVNSTSAFTIAISTQYLRTLRL